jgi:Tol biopolymer transport system component
VEGQRKYKFRHATGPGQQHFRSVLHTGWQVGHIWFFPPGRCWLYSYDASGVGQLYKISSSGGDPIELTKSTDLRPFAALSPDGRLLAYCRVQNQGANRTSKFVIQNLDSGRVRQELDAPPYLDELGWTPDQQALVYLRYTGDGSQQMFVQRFDGGSAIQVTHFDSEPKDIRSYAWSQDCKKIAIVRARSQFIGAVLFTAFR